MDKAHNRFPLRRTKTPPPLKRLKFNLDTFIVGSSNQLAYNAAKAVVDEEQSPFNPLFIHGGYGVGKTHLLQGICNAVCKSRP
ncbi:MAG: DnaA ATPase domain-containing protein, partial [Planctomycetota bacterium]